jgi:D-xylose 1-dehydrogenase (NADP+, D-xylono-1,5-lactone-forming)
MDIVNWGIVSTAHINRRVIPMIQSSPRGRLVAVASRDLIKGQAYAATWKIPHTFGSYEEMLASDTVDAVYISLPNHLHCEWSIKALQAGKHVLCEKPIAISVNEVEKMIRTSQETGKHLAEAFMFRHHPQTKLVGEWIRTGKLGEITLVQGMFSFSMQNKDTNVRLVANYGGGSLWDIGVYPLSFAQYIYGHPPKSVIANQWVGESGVDESFAGQMDYGEGQTAQIGCSFRNPYATPFSIHGTLGRLEMNRPFSNINEADSQLLFTPVDGETEKVNIEKIDAYLAEIEDMQAAILDGTPNLIHLEESLDHIRTARALYAAAQTRQIVYLD